MYLEQTHIYKKKTNPLSE